MTRDDLEARIWEAAGRCLTGAQVDDIVAAAEVYAVLRREEQREEQVRVVLRHEHATDLHPVIAVLAEALMPDVAHIGPRRSRSKRAARAARFRRYSEHRLRGEPPACAALRTGVSPRTARRYEAELRTANDTTTTETRAA